MAMNPKLLRPRASRLFLLDQYGSAAAAYSLRRLRTGHTGPAVQVRRSSDNAEDTFTPEQVANGTLASWVGAGNDGFVKTWYDQGGAGADVSQTTSGNQPKIVSSGTLVTEGAFPAIEFDGTNDRLTRPQFSFTEYTNLCVYRCTAGSLTASRVVWHNGNANGVGLNVSANTFFDKLSYFERSVKDNFFGTANTTFSMIAGVRTSSKLTAFQNGSTTTLTPGTATTPTTAFTVGAMDNSPTLHYSGKLIELVFWASDLESSFTKITDLANRYYKVY